jgi:hypothetical protein
MMSSASTPRARCFAGEFARESKANRKSAAKSTPTEIFCQTLELTLETVRAIGEVVLQELATPRLRYKI